jgi:nicotinamidase-related amidase
MASFLQVIDEAKDFVTNHEFINRFGVGPIENINLTLSDDSKYPVLWIVPQDVRILNNSIEYKFRFLIFDKDDTDDSLRNQKLNDTLATAIDIVKYFSEDTRLEIEVTNTSNASPFEQQFVDYTVGWYLDLSLATDAQNNPCNIA